MKFREFMFIAGVCTLLYLVVIGGSGCAQFGSPTGGPRDSIPPVLLKATPEENTINFDQNRIVFNFDEYIDVQEVQNNVLVSPFPKNTPQITFKLRTVTVKLRDTLLPNTTYSINFGNAIRDNNEGNPYRNFTYVFSTGSTIDSLTASGRVLVAETGKADSTIIAMLYRNVHDTTVRTRKPDYVARLDSSGNFRFRNLSAGTYKIYALKDGDGGKTYNSPIELFAFADNDLIVNDSTASTNLYAYAEEREKPRLPTGQTPTSAKAEKKLRVANNLSGGSQDLLGNLTVSFSNPLKTLDTQRIMLSDTNYNRLPASMTLNSARQTITIRYPWAENTAYRLLIDKEAVSDSLNLVLTKSDTVRFTSRKTSDYGSLLLRFTGLEKYQHPVLQFVKNNEVVKSAPLRGAQWTDKLFEPGDYELRVLDDLNQNGVWDPGNYERKLQPERAITVDSRLNIRANWDNDRDVKL